MPRILLFLFLSFSASATLPSFSYLEADQAFQQSSPILLDQIESRPGPVLGTWRLVGVNYQIESDSLLTSNRDELTRWGRRIHGLEYIKVEKAFESFRYQCLVGEYDRFLSRRNYRIRNGTRDVPCTTNTVDGNILRTEGDGSVSYVNHRGLSDGSGIFQLSIEEVLSSVYGPLPRSQLNLEASRIYHWNWVSPASIRMNYDSFTTHEREEFVIETEFNNYLCRVKDLDRLICKTDRTPEGIYYLFSR